MTDTIKSTLTFKDYMSVPSGDNFHNFLDNLHDAGIYTSTCEDDFLSSEYAEDNIQSLSDNLCFWALWTDAKLKGFEALREEGFEAIKATAELTGHVFHNIDGAEVGADWCRRDGVCYVKYAGMVQTAVPTRAKTKRERDKGDARYAEHALQLMYEHELEAA